LSAAALMPLPSPAGIAKAACGAASPIAAPAKVINKNLRISPLLPVSPPAEEGAGRAEPGVNVRFSRAAKRAFSVLIPFLQLPIGNNSRVKSISPNARLPSRRASDYFANRGLRRERRG